MSADYERIRWQDRFARNARSLAYLNGRLDEFEGVDHHVGGHATHLLEGQKPCRHCAASAMNADSELALEQAHA